MREVLCAMQVKDWDRWSTAFVHFVIPESFVLTPCKKNISGFGAAMTGINAF